MATMLRQEPGVYKIEHLESGRIYIGSTHNLRKRWQAHQRGLCAGTHYNTKLQRAWNKYGATAFLFTVLEWLPPLQLRDREQVLIDRLKPFFNVSPIATRPPGHVGPHSEATKAKIRAKRTLQVITPEAVAKQRAKVTGAVRTPEQRARIAAGCIGREMSAETRAKLSALRTGAKSSAETCAKISAASTGRAHTPEARAKISAARTGKKLSPESIAKRTATRAANAQGG
jgi:group I intron endonuclease